MPIPSPIEPRFKARYIIDPVTSCWKWTAGKCAGYGQITDRGKTWYAHIYSYELHIGQVPVGMEVCHSCDNPACVNPDHLFLGTHNDNMLDAMSKRRLGPKCAARGERASSAKLTESDVLAIRASSATCVSVAQKYGVDHTLISKIRNRKIWRHI